MSDDADDKKQFSINNIKVAIAIIVQIVIFVVAVVTQYFAILDELQNLKDRVIALENRPHTGIMYPVAPLQPADQEPSETSPLPY